MPGGLVRLTEPVSLAGRSAQSAVVFGPHETNLGHRRSFSPRHTAYYERRAAGGAGIIVTETASVHESDWPYERAPLAADSEPGWRQIAASCHPHGTLVLAGLGHTGLQGSSAYSQAALWGPSRFPDVASREVPMELEDREIGQLVAGFAAAAAAAARAGADGVEIDAGPGALLRQFHSGLTSSRQDRYGTDRLRLTREVLAAVRDEIGTERVLSLRLSCDELAPWAGVTPEIAASQAAELSQWLDLLVVVRGGPYSASAYRPDAHAEPMFNTGLAKLIRKAVAGAVPVVLQGSVVDPAAAQRALDDEAADLVEMTRALIADADLVAKARAGRPERIRPCILCNARCRVRDARNPIVSCVADPRSGHETEDEPDPVWVGPPAAAETGSREAGSSSASLAWRAEAGDGGTGRAAARDVLVVGGGPAGLEAARVAALGGHRVRLAERSDRLGGAARVVATAPGRERIAKLTGWLETECRRLGVRLDTGTEITAADLAAARERGTLVLLATGSRPSGRLGGLAVDAPVVEALTVLRDGPGMLPDGPVVIDDPAGGPAGVALAEWLAASGRQVTIVTPDSVTGTQLSLTGDLADANGRLARAGVSRELRSVLREVRAGRAVTEHVWTGERHEIECAALIDCGHRLPDDGLYSASPWAPRAGDCVAPRTIYEAVLEGRRLATQIGRPKPLAEGPSGA